MIALLKQVYAPASVEIRILVSKQVSDFVTIRVTNGQAYYKKYGKTKQQFRCDTN